MSPSPSRKERHPNEELGYLLRNYQEDHPQGSSLDLTLPEETIETKQNRRRADRAIWAGLGRDPEEGEVPTIVVEFVSRGKVNQERDYVAKRAEYREIGVREYWVIDRFRRTLTVYTFSGESDQERVIPENQNYETPLLPGFELAAGPVVETGRPLGEEAALKSFVLIPPASSLYREAIWRPRFPQHRSSAWSWAASQTGRRCAMPPSS